MNKLKTVLIAALTAAVVISPIGDVAAALVNEGYDFKIYSEDFSSGSVNTSVFEVNTDARKPIAVDLNDSEHGYVMKLATGVPDSSDNMARIRSSYLDSGCAKLSDEPSEETCAKLSQVKLEMDLYFDKKINGVVDIRGYRSSYFEPLKFNDSGVMTFGDGSETIYNSGCWYSLRVYFDFSAGTYTVYLNNTRYVKNAELAESQNGGAVVRWGIYLSRQQSNASFIYIDNMKCYTPDILNKTGAFVTQQGEDLSKIHYLSRLRKVYNVSETIGNTLYEDNFKDGINKKGNYDGKGKWEFDYAAFDPFSDHTHTARFYNCEEGAAATAYTDSIFRMRNNKINSAYSTQMLSGDELDAAEKVIVSMDVYTSHLSNAAVQAVTHYGELQRATVNVLSFDVSGNVNVGTASTQRKIANYESGTWYNYKLYFDFTKDCYTVWRNNELLATEISLPDDYIYGLAYGMVFVGSVHAGKQYIELDNLSVKSADVEINSESKAQRDSLRLTAAISEDGENIISSDFIEASNLNQTEYKLITASFDITDCENAKRYYLIGNISESITDLSDMVCLD